MARVEVACAVAGAYDRHSAAMLHSVCEQAGAGVHVHYLHGPSYPRRSAELIGGMLERLGATATFHEVADDRVAGLPVVGPFTKAMWYRIFLPDLAPASERVLYLDVDTLATGALDPLWEVDLSGHYVGAVTNVFERELEDRPRRLGLAGPEVYFNSGVLLMNLDAMRRDWIAEALRECAITRAAELEWPDQDALNLVLSGRRLELPPRWNVMNSLRYPWSVEVYGEAAVREAREHPAIRHYEGPRENKPWHWGARRADRALYARHRAATPWPAVELDDMPQNRLIRLASRAKRRVRA